VAVVIDNLPMIYPLFLRLFQKVDDTLASHYQSRNKRSKHSDGDGSYPMYDHEEKKSKFVHPLSMRNATLSGSSESVVRAERVEKSHNISIVREASVVVSDSRNSDEDVIHHPARQRAGTGYAVTCNHTGDDRLQNDGRDKSPWR
jgi:hypothetical protein